MKFIETPIKDLLVLQPNVFEDERGYFFESFRLNLFKEHGIEAAFIQDNQSKSNKGVLRGLHFQNPPYAQGKLVRVIKGAVLDVVVDIRKLSPTFGNTFVIELNEENKTMLWVPPGFAHGFITLEDETIFFYKCTNVYNKESEGGIIWNDLDLNIDWGKTIPILSAKDYLLSSFKELDSQF